MSRRSLLWPRCDYLRLSAYIHVDNLSVGYRWEHLSYPPRHCYWHVVLKKFISIVNWAKLNFALGIVTGMNTMRKIKKLKIFIERERYFTQPQNVHRFHIVCRWICSSQSNECVYMYIYFLSLCQDSIIVQNFFNIESIFILIYVIVHAVFIICFLYASFSASKDSFHYRLCDDICFNFISQSTVYYVSWNFHLR